MKTQPDTKPTGYIHPVGWILLSPLFIVLFPFAFAMEHPTASLYITIGASLILTIFLIGA